MRENRYAVAVKPIGRKWRRVYVNNRGAPRWKRKGNSGQMTGPEARRVKKWARRRGYRFRGVRINPYPHLYGDVDANASLLRKLERVGKRLEVSIRIRSGRRTIAEQAVLYELYKKGKGPLAAKPNSNAPHTKGEAADCGILGQNIGNYPGAREAMKAEGLCLPVKGESWHVEEEEGNTWRG